jgi:hypothetical protein
MSAMGEQDRPQRRARARKDHADRLVSRGSRERPVLPILGVLLIARRMVAAVATTLRNARYRGPSAYGHPLPRGPPSAFGISRYDKIMKTGLSTNSKAPTDMPDAMKDVEVHRRVGEPRGYPCLVVLNIQNDEEEQV